MASLLSFSFHFFLSFFFLFFWTLCLNESSGKESSAVEFSMFHVDTGFHFVRCFKELFTEAHSIQKIFYRLSFFSGLCLIIANDFQLHHLPGS